MGWSTVSRHKRGYGSTWDKLRRRVLRRDAGMCQCDECKKLKRIRAAHHVDHIIPRSRGGSDDMSNLRAVNRECHKRITIEQNGGTYKPKYKIGIDGLPIK